MSTLKLNTLRLLILRYVLFDSSRYYLILTYIIYIQCSSSSTKSIFDELPALSAPPKSDLRDELDHYLNTDPEHVTDAITWWYEKCFVYPRLHRMVLDYLTIPGELIFINTYSSSSQQ